MFNGSSQRVYPDSFGPVALDAFDFTPLFENTILSIVPSTLLLLALPLRLFWLQHQSRKVNKTWIYAIKLQVLSAYAIMQLVVLILWALRSSTKSRAALPAAALDFVAALGICILSRREHVNSVKPSSIINVYLFLSFLFDCVRCRTLWLDKSTTTIAATFTSMLTVKFLVLFTEAIEKRGILLEPYQNSSPETTSSIYSLSFFWWLNALLTIGFRRIIANDDLYPIDGDMTSAVLQQKSQASWASVNQSKPRALFCSTFWTLRYSFAAGVIPRLILIGFKYTQPFLLYRTVEFASNEDQSDNIGWGLTTAYAFVLVGSAISTGAFYHMAYRYVVAVRGCLVTLIYSKTLDLSVTALDESAAMTLMATDTETICQAFETIHEFWAAPLEVGIAMFLLYRQLHLAFLGPATVALFAFAGISILARRTGQAQKAWIQAVQTRVDVTTSMLASMKSVKMLGLQGRLTEAVQGLRIFELKVSRTFRKYTLGRIFLAMSIMTLAPFTTFACFVLIAFLTGLQLNAASAYTGMSLIFVLQEPMNTLIRTIPMMNVALACFSRIQKYLGSDMLKDHRLLLQKPTESYSHERSVEDDNNIELAAIHRNSNLDIESATIVARNASFAWSENISPVICDASFIIRRSQSTFIIGPVGAGKSTLLKGLLGEVPSSKGFVYTASMSIAYVDQTAWIQNATIQENILGISPYDQDWYDRVIYCCALEQDIAMFPNGHSTPVGSGGISLSGGQRQRVALARAVYSQKGFLVLDDIFSGLDVTTEEQIFNRLFSKQGLLRSNGCTVLLVTHAVQRILYADHIIVLNSNGEISEQGSFIQLQHSSGYIQQLIATTISRDDGAEKEPSGNSSKISSSIPLEKDARYHMEELNRKTGDFAVYKYYFSSIGWLPTVIFILFVVSTGAGIKLNELLLIYWTDSVEKEGNVANGFYLGLFGLLTGCGVAGLMAAASQLLLFIVPRSSQNLHGTLLETVMNAPLAFFTTTDIGQTVNRFSQDMSVVDLHLPYNFLDLFFTICIALFGAVLLCVSAGYFAATVPPVILILWVLQKIYLKTSRQIRLLDLEAKSPLYSHFIETLSGLSTIRAFGWRSAFMEQNLSRLDISQKPYYLLFCIQRWLGLVLDLIVAVLAVILMVLVVKLRKDIGSGYIGLALLNVINFNSTLSEIIKGWTSLETALGAISRLKTFAAQTKSENLPQECNSIMPEWPSRGAIEFTNVSASYNPTSQPALANFSISILPGQKIGVCGRSGSGKSSLVMTLFRMLELVGGQVIIDGVDITTISRQEIRSRLNAIPQDPYFIKGTVRENADPTGVGHADEAIISALQDVRLWEIILNKGGLDAPLDYDFFSHGQRQLFCLARATLRKSKIVVLDEATSSVDKDSDALMQRVIREKFWDCTIIAVAHRLDTILDFDKIALLGDGKLLEFDEPAKLLGRRSLFRDLYDSSL